MNPNQLALLVAVLAAMLSSGKTSEETAKMAAILVQLGDTLATIATQQEALEKE